MKNLLGMAVVATAVAFSSVAARADTLAHEFFPGGTPPHNDPQDFVITDQGGIELGLQAQSRGPGAAFTRVGNTYFATVPWNFDFVIDTNPGNAITPASVLTDYTALITVSGAATGTYNPLFTPNDNLGSSTLAQNSENLSFSSLFSSAQGGSGAPLNPNLPGLYTFTLTLTPTATGAAAGGATITDVMNVSVAPLPSAAGMGFAMLGLVGGAVLLRKKLRVA